MNYDVIINNRSMSDRGFLAVQRPAEPSPEKKIVSNEVLSRDGAFYRDTGFYKDYEQEIEFNFMVPQQSEWAAKVRELRRIFETAETLMFSDDQQFQRRIKLAVVGDCARLGNLIGKATVKLTLDPYHYFVPGQRWIKHPELYRYNEHDKSRPIYRIIGNGEATLTVNGYSCTVIVPGQIYLDTERSVAHGPESENLNANTNADYERLLLKHGDNQVSVSGDFTLWVYPNWRQI